jgi:hypothetical protein
MDLDPSHFAGRYPGTAWAHTFGGVPSLLSVLLAITALIVLFGVISGQSKLRAPSYRSERKVCVMGILASALLLLLALALYVRDLVVLYPLFKSEPWTQPFSKYCFVAAMVYFMPNLITLCALGVTAKILRKREAINCGA